jgi:hypothetical protein
VLRRLAAPLGDKLEQSPGGKLTLAPVRLPYGNEPTGTSDQPPVGLKSQA